MNKYSTKLTDEEVTTLQKLLLENHIKHTNLDPHWGSFEVIGAYLAPDFSQLSSIVKSMGFTMQTCITPDDNLEIRLVR